jgi:hypothetical protein
MNECIQRWDPNGNSESKPDEEVDATRSRMSVSAHAYCALQGITSSAGEQLEDLETTQLTYARRLFHTIDGDDVEFRVFLAKLERSLEFGRVVPSL